MLSGHLSKSAFAATPAPPGQPDLWLHEGPLPPSLPPSLSPSCGLQRVAWTWILDGVVMTDFSQNRPWEELTVTPLGTGCDNCQEPEVDRSWCERRSMCPQRPRQGRGRALGCGPHQELRLEQWKVVGGGVCRERATPRSGSSFPKTAGHWGCGEARTVTEDHPGGSRVCRRSLSLILIPFLLCILKYYLVRFLSMRSFYDKHS